MATIADGVSQPQLWDFWGNIKADLKFFVKNNIYYRKKYKLVRAKQLNIFYLVFDPTKKHAGIADRLKAVVSCYNVAKANGFKFKVVFETPFHLSSFLTPQYAWEASMNDLEYSLLDTKVINEVSWRRIKKLKNNKQYHCYCYTGNVMPRVFPDTGRKWRDLFFELFKPSELLENAYKKIKPTDDNYVSVHFRFVNALERFENTFFDNHIDNSRKRKELIERCKKGLFEIAKENPETIIYVFSDSKVFIESLEGLPFRTFGSKDIGHISENSNNISQLRSFLDLYVMSKGKAVYRCCASELYSISHYALLAATIGDIPFYDQKV